VSKQICKAHNVGDWPAESEVLGRGWDGALRRPKSCFVKEGAKLVAKAGYGRISKGREFQMTGAATEKLRDPKPVRTRGTSNKLEPEEHQVRDGTECFSTEWR